MLPFQLMNKMRIGPPVCVWTKKGIAAITAEHLRKGCPDKPGSFPRGVG